MDVIELKIRNGLISIPGKYSSQELYQDALVTLRCPVPFPIDRSNLWDPWIDG